MPSSRTVSAVPFPGRSTSLIACVFCLLVLSLVPGSASAQWKDNGSSTTTGDNVGIGTSTPQMRLDVKGQTVFRPRQLGDLGSVRMQRIDEDNRSHSWRFLHMTNAYRKNALEIWEYLEGSDGKDCGSADAAALCTNQFTLASGGYVGVGIANPQARLHVGGDTRMAGTLSLGVTSLDGHRLAVNGSMKARKVVVTTDGFADYVFDDDYDLRSLREVRVFIDDNGHLPGMPAGAVVEADGQDLGAIQVALTEKVEELVLYAIDQEERADRLADELTAERDAREQLEARLSRLEARLNALSTALDE